MGITTEREAWTPHDLIYGPRTALEPQVSPDGTQIVYALAQADPERPDTTPFAHLVRSGVDGSGVTQLTDAGHHDVHPRWSPDGTRIAFVSDRNPEGSTLRVIPAGGGEAAELASHRMAIDDLAWSPDGARIAYTVPVDKNRKLEVELFAGKNGDLTRLLWQVVPAKKWAPDERLDLYIP